MILSKQEIVQAVVQKRISIAPFNQKNVNGVSIDCSLGNEFLVFPRKSSLKLEINDIFAVENSNLAKKVSIPDSGVLELKHGDFVLGVTKERIRLPENICGRIEGRSRFARIGLLVHISSALIQPGSDNVQVLEITNLSPYTLKLKPGTKICQVILQEVKGNSSYKGRYARQERL